MENYYAKYEEWKGWGEDQFMVLTDSERAYYDAEFSDVPVRGEKVLEIGFGSGTLLAWLREKGAELSGTEISEQGRTLAARRGVTVLDIDLCQAESMAGQFGVVAAFDVLEHLTYSQIATLLDRIAILLRPGGYFIARFPNGASPFGRMHQHGDITHISTLTENKIVQLMSGKPFSVQRAGDAAAADHGGFATRLAKYGRRLLRRGFERGVSALYGFDLPFHPNIALVLRRSDTAA